MEVQTPARSGLHPLVATAAVAVIIASGVGVAAMTGLLPNGSAKQAEPALVAQAAPVSSNVPAPEPVAATPTPAPVVAAEPAPTPKPKPKPVAKAVHHPKPVVHKAVPVEETPVQVAQASLPAPGSYPAVPPDYRPPVQVQQPPPVPVAAARPVCYDCGTVESMREIDKKGEGTGLGAVAGGLGGLVLGHQIGNGTGNRVATVLGAVGGAFAGNQIEKNTRTTKSYEISVRMEDGGYRTIASANPPTWRTGDHVRVVNGTLQLDNR